MKRHNQFTVNLLLLTLALVMSCQFVLADVTDSIYNVTFSTSSCGTPVVRQFSHGNVLTIYADNDSAHIFTGWSDGITANPRVVTVTSDTSFIAQYAAAGSGFGTLHTATVSFNGCSTSSVQQYSNIANVTITAEPEPHYHFVNWSDGNTDNPRMIHITSDTNLVANVAIDQYTITLNGSHVTTTGAGTYGWGSQVTITAVPDANYHFVCWSDSNTNATRTFTAEENVTLTALVEGDPFTLTTLGSNGSVTGGGTYPYNSVVSLTAVPDEHYHFLYWSDGDTNRVRTITVTENHTYIAVFAIDRHTVTLPAENGMTTGAGTYNYGTDVQISAFANQHYHFVRWSDGETASSRYIAVSQDTVITAIFEGNPHTVTTSVTNGVIAGGGTFPYGTTVTLAVVPDIHYRFVSWSDGNTDNPRSFVLTQDTLMTAMTDLTQHNVTVIVENADVEGDGVYSYNSEAEITVIANEHYNFVQWSDGSTSATKTITVTNDTTLYAIVIPEMHTVSVGTSGNGTVDGGGIFGYNTPVTISATPDAHYHFVSWSDGDTANPRTFTLTQDTSFSAVIEIDRHTVTTSGEHATVTGGGEYDYGTTITLAATVDDHCTFVSWSDGCTDNPRQMVVTSDTILTAITEVDQVQLIVSAYNGTVEGSGSYDYGTTVTMFVIPNQGYMFDSWNDGNTDNPRVVILTYDTLFIAMCEKYYEVKVSTSDKYTVTGAGIYYAGDVATLEVTSLDDDYEFSHWSDYNTDNPRSIVVNSDISLGVTMKKVSTPVDNINMDEINFVLAPNPVDKSDDVEVSISGEIDSECVLTLLDASGNIVDIFKTDLFPFVFAAPAVDGTYFVRIVSDNQDITLKLIVK